MMVLNQLIRRIEPKAYDPKNRSHLIYNPVRGGFEAEPPRWGGKSLQYYEVVCSATATRSATGTIGPVGIHDPASGMQIEIDVEYDAWILPENARDLVRSVAGDQPGERLAQLLIDAVRRRVASEPQALAGDAEDRAMELARELERHLLQQHGLNLTLALRLRRDHAVGKEYLLPMELEVAIQLCDYREPLAAKLKVVCAFDADAHLAVIDAARRRAPVREVLAATCRAYFLDLGLHQLRAELASAAGAALRERLAEAVAPYHLRLRVLDLALADQAAPTPPTGFAEIEVPSNIEILGYPRKVDVRTRVQLELADEGRYRRAGAPDLDAWAQTRVGPIVRATLFEASYSQLLMQSSAWEQRILHELKRAASSIGYGVRAQITTPDGPVRDFLYPQLLEVSGDFATAVDDVTSCLQVVLRIQLESWQSVARELDRGVDLETTFKATVHEEVAAYVHELQPGFLFTRFTTPRDHTGRPVEPVDGQRDERPAVEDALRKRITNALAARYGLQVLALAVVQGASRIRDTYLALTRAPSIPFEVKVPLRGYLGPVDHHGELRVETVAPGGWSRFQDVLPNASVVADAAVAALRTLLDVESPGPGGGVPADVVSEAVRVGMPGMLADTLGLAVKVAYWHKDPNAAELEQLETRREIYRDDLVQLRELRRSLHAQIAEHEENARRLRGVGENEAADREVQKAGELRARWLHGSGLGGLALLPEGTP